MIVDVSRIFCRNDKSLMYHVQKWYGGIRFGWQYRILLRHSRKVACQFDQAPLVAARTGVVTCPLGNAFVDWL